MSPRLDYRSAFLQMRKHRVNMNLLCDHNMASFLTNTSLLVEQLRDVTYINLFLTELRSLEKYCTIQFFSIFCSSEKRM